MSDMVTIREQDLIDNEVEQGPLAPAERRERIRRGLS
jgi:hypothetical protein